LDRTAKGRDESATEPLWLRCHDEYEQTPGLVQLDARNASDGVGAGRPLTGDRRPMSTSPAEFNAQIIDEFRGNEGRVGGRFEGTPLFLAHHPGAPCERSRT
jgi:hypothetical protein